MTRAQIHQAARDKNKQARSGKYEPNPLSIIMSAPHVKASMFT